MSILSLDDVPKINDPYVWADYLELHCLASQDNIASIDSAAKEARSQSDNGIDTELFDELGSDPTYILSPEANDKVLGYAEDALRLTYTRSKFYGEIYPFEVDKTGKELSLKNDLTFEQHLYIALLLCSNHAYCVPHKDIFTLGFEKISKYAFKGILPPEGVVMHLGTRQGDDDDVVETATNKLLDKIKAIAVRLNLKCIADDKEFSDHNTGDGGIDLIGLISISEEGMGEEIISFGQSATSKIKDEIYKKQGDAAYSKWCKWIKFNSTTNNYLFIAASIRKNDGSFITGLSRNSEAIIIDRGRIIRFISSWRQRSEENSKALVIPGDINDCITQLVA
ncbi:MAG: hypothetical protein OEY89_06905 [Gammaproteobacteria bacterium]|nr:hypothetical protein [Gammaproteobacteria bacterium]